MMSRFISRLYEGRVGGEMKQMRHATYYPKQHKEMYHPKQHKEMYHSKQHKELYQLTMSTLYRN